MSNQQLRIPIFELEIDLLASSIRNMDYILIHKVKTTVDSEFVSLKPPRNFTIKK